MEWFTKERLRTGLGFVWAGLMIVCLFVGRTDLSIFAALMLILMEVEKINRRNESGS
jgi:hypothetical protein